MLELLCPKCSEICPMTEQVQSDDTVIWDAECACGYGFERKDEPGEIKVTKEPEE